MSRSILALAACLPVLAGAAPAAAEGFQAFAWGDNHVGQLTGVDTQFDTGSPKPLAMPGLANVTAVAVGDYHSLALLADGSVRAWGKDYSGQLGNGSATSTPNPPGSSLPPVAVVGIPTASGAKAIAVSASDADSMALMSDGTIEAWGDNLNGQLGDGTNDQHDAPVPVANIGQPGHAGAVAIAAGNQGSLAALSDGRVATWGTNYDGRLGVGVPQSALAQSALPVIASGIGAGSSAPATEVAAGTIHDLALLSDGSVVAWGDNTAGQLGFAGGGSSDVPVPVHGLTGPVKSIAAGAFHSLALLADGTVAAWGDNSEGQLGNTSLGSGTSAPSVVPGLNNVVAIAATQYESYALKSDGTLWAWGRNMSGQQGDPEFVGPTAIAVLGDGVVSIATGSEARHAVATAHPVSSTSGNLNFGTVQPGTTSSPLQVSVVDNGAAGLDQIQAQITGPGAGDFKATTNSADCNEPLDHGGRCQIDVTFTPSGGRETAELSIVSNAPNVPPKVELTGSTPQPPPPPTDGLIAFLRDGAIWTVAGPGTPESNHSDPFPLTGERQLTHPDTSGNVGSTIYMDGPPSWSPDGKRIAFVRAAVILRGPAQTGPVIDLGNSHVWVMNADGSSQQDLGVNDADFGRPVWTPDGRSLAITTGPSVTVPFEQDIHQALPPDVFSGTLISADPADPYRAPLPAPFPLAWSGPDVISPAGAALYARPGGASLVGADGGANIFVRSVGARDRYPESAAFFPEVAPDAWARFADPGSRLDGVDYRADLILSSGTDDAGFPHPGVFAFSSGLPLLAPGRFSAPYGLYFSPSPNGSKLVYTRPDPSGNADELAGALPALDASGALTKTVYTTPTLLANGGAPDWQPAGCVLCGSSVAPPPLKLSLPPSFAPGEDVVSTTSGNVVLHYDAPRLAGDTEGWSLPANAAIAAADLTICAHRAVRPGQRCRIPVRFDPRTPGRHTILLYPNAREDPGLAIPLMGVGAPAPVVRSVRLVRHVLVITLSRPGHVRIKLFRLAAARCKHKACPPPKRVATLTGRGGVHPLRLALPERLRPGRYLAAIVVAARGWISPVVSMNVRVS